LNVAKFAIGLLIHCTKIEMIQGDKAVQSGNNKVNYTRVFGGYDKNIHL